MKKYCLEDNLDLPKAPSFIYSTNISLAERAGVWNSLLAEETASCGAVWGAAGIEQVCVMIIMVAVLGTLRKGNETVIVQEAINV